MIGPLVALLLPAAAAWLWLRALRLSPLPGGYARQGALAFAIGLGASSLTTMWGVAAVGRLPSWFVQADALFWLVLGALGWLLGRHAPAVAGAMPPRGRTVDDWIVRAMFAVVAGIALASLGAEYAAAPHGQWDAWVMWNHKARFMVRGDDDWTAFLHIPWANPSHPILVSTSVARLWAYGGTESTRVPFLLHAAIGAATVALVVGALDPDRPRAWIAGTVLVAPWTFVHGVAAQTADVPLGLFITATIVVSAWPRTGLRQPISPAHVALGGLLAGLAAWTKNEGLLFCGAMALLAIVTARRAGRASWAVWWVAGAAPALVILGWLKWALAPLSPEYFGQAPSAVALVERLTSVGQHMTVLGAVWPHWLRWGGGTATGVLPLAMAAAAVAAIRGRGTTRPLVLVAGVLLVGYYAVWLIAPLPTAALVSATFDRLLLQLWPLLILAAFSPGER